MNSNNVAEPASRAVELIRRKGVLRPRDLAPHGIARAYLQQLVDAGTVERVGRGLYPLSGAPVTENHSLAEACKRVPGGVVCLLSALRFHGLTTQAPFEVWLAIDAHAWRPRVEHPPLRIVRFSGKVLDEGIETHEIEGVRVKVYSAAKTVADCFKFRNKIGLDVALEDCSHGIVNQAQSFLHFGGLCSFQLNSALSLAMQDERFAISESGRIGSLTEHEEPSILPHIAGRKCGTERRDGTKRKRTPAGFNRSHAVCR